jgi:hypothetical protein
MMKSAENVLDSNAISRRFRVLALWQIGTMRSNDDVEINSLDSYLTQLLLEKPFDGLNHGGKRAD